MKYDVTVVLAPSGPSNEGLMVACNCGNAGYFSKSSSQPGISELICGHCAAKRVETTDPDAAKTLRETHYAKAN